MNVVVARRTILPPEESLEPLVGFVGQLGSERPAVLVGPDGPAVALPESVYAALRQVILAMSDGQAVTIAPHRQRLTIQEAADLLGVSSQAMARMLSDGQIPVDQAGPHRRVLLRDVLEFQEARREHRREGLDALVVESEPTGAYQATTSSVRTR